MRERLAHAPGAVLVDRFPAERWTDEQNRSACGLFSALVGPLMEQDHAGTLDSIKETDPLGALFLGGYGINDGLFALFFLVVALVNFRRERS